MKINPKYISFYYEGMTEYPPFQLDPKKTALLIVDMQKEFIDDTMGEALEFKKNGEWERWQPFRNRIKETVIPNTVRLLSFFRENQMRVTFGRIACASPDGEDRSPVQKSDGWNNIFIHKDSVEAEFVDELKPLPTEIVVDKTTDSVLTGTNYARIIRNMGIDTVVVTGIVTDQCVGATIRSLADEGFSVICVEDCCAAGSMELHDAELKIMNIIYCSVLSTDQTIEVLEESLKK